MKGKSFLYWSMKESYLFDEALGHPRRPYHIGINMKGKPQTPLCMRVI